MHCSTSPIFRLLLSLAFFAPLLACEEPQSHVQLDTQHHRVGDHSPYVALHCADQGDEVLCPMDMTSEDAVGFEGRIIFDPARYAFEHFSCGYAQACPIQSAEHVFQSHVDGTHLNFLAISPVKRPLPLRTHLTARFKKLDDAAFVDDEIRLDFMLFANADEALFGSHDKKALSGCTEACDEGLVCVDGMCVADCYPSSNYYLNYDYGADNPLSRTVNIVDAAKQIGYMIGLLEDFGPEVSIDCANGGANVDETITIGDAVATMTTIIGDADANLGSTLVVCEKVEEWLS